MVTFELVLQEFDGDTDLTDDKIIWVSSPDAQTLDAAIGDAHPLVRSIFLTDVHPEDCGVDLTLPEQAAQLPELIRKRSDNPFNDNPGE